MTMATTTPQYLSKLSKVRKVCNLSKVQHHDRGKVCEFCFNLYILTDTSHTVPKSAPIPRDVIDTDGYLADIQVIDIEDQDTLEVLKKTPKESSATSTTSSCHHISSTTKSFRHVACAREWIFHRLSPTLNRRFVFSKSLLEILCPLLPRCQHWDNVCNQHIRYVMMSWAPQTIQTYRIRTSIERIPKMGKIQQFCLHVAKECRAVS